VKSSSHRRRDATNQFCRVGSDGVNLARDCMLHAEEQRIGFAARGMRCLNRDSSSLSMFVHRLRPVIRYLILAAILTCQLNAGNLIMPLIDSSCHRTELHRTTSDHRSTALQRNGEKLQPPLNIWRLTDLLISTVITPPADRGAEYCDDRVCVCVFVCLFAILSSELHVGSSRFLCVLLWP